MWPAAVAVRVNLSIYAAQVGCWAPHLFPAQEWERWDDLSMVGPIKDIERQQDGIFVEACFALLSCIGILRQLRVGCKVLSQPRVLPSHTNTNTAVHTPPFPQ